jgi:putative nucleotidyltransferase with HDIG domain
MHVSLELTQIEENRLAETLEKYRSRLSRRETASSIVGVALPALLWVALAVEHPLGRLPAVPAGACVLILVAAMRVRIDMPLGYTAPTQLAYVPLLFAVPPLLGPPLVVLGLLIVGVLDVVRGKTPAGRLLLAPGNAAFALGPAAVFTLAGTSADHAALPLLALALLAQFAVDFGVSSLRFAIGREVSFSEQLRDLWIYAVDAAFACVALPVALQVAAHPALVLSLLPLLALLDFFARERRGRLESSIELGNAYRGTALVLGDVIEADDGYTGVHCKSVVSLALAVGEELGIAPERQRNLEFGALLHDVGKVAIPKEIFNKPGKLDPEEWTIIKTHTVEGQRMLDRVGGFMRDVGTIVRSHHERWDGSGYPDMLAGEQIPLEARIIAACDTWNAMRTDRSYRRALAYETALAELVSCSGTQFDPQIVEVLVRVLERDERPVAPASENSAVPAAAAQANAVAGAPPAGRAIAV